MKNTPSFLLYIALIAISCDKPGNNSPTVDSSNQATLKPPLSASEPSEIIGEITSEKVDGSQLKTSDIIGQDQMFGDYHALQLLAEADENADFMQFAICSQEDPNNCNPSLDKPEEFVFGITYPTPPTGLVKIMVRSCIRPERALDPSKSLCGPWEDIRYIQKANNDDATQAELDQEQSLRKSMVAKCAKIHEHLKEYKKKDLSTKDPNFMKMVDNLLALGRDFSCEIIISDEMETVEEEVMEANKTEQNLKLTESQNPSDLGIAVISLGSVAVLGGIVGGVAYSNVEYGMKRYWTVQGMKNSIKPTFNQNAVKVGANPARKLFSNNPTRSQVPDTKIKKLNNNRKKGAIGAAIAMTAGILGIALGMPLGLNENDSNEKILLDQVGSIYSSIKEEKTKREKILLQLSQNIESSE